MEYAFSKTAVIIGIIMTISACSGGKSDASNSKKQEQKQVDSIYKPSENEKIVTKIMLHNDAKTYFDNGKSYLDYPAYSFVTAKQLRQAYADNEARADKEYKGEKLIISGTVGSINSGLGDIPYVTIKSGDMFQDPQISFSRKYRELAIDLNKNQKVTFYCIGNGSVIGTPMLKDCKPVTDAIDEVVEEKTKEVNKLYTGNPDVDTGIREIAYNIHYSSLITDDFSKCEDASDIKCIEEVITTAKKKISSEEKEKIKVKLQPLADYLRLDVSTKQ